jgi:hypothetical protein
MTGRMWVAPEDVAPGAKVGLVLAWFPHPQIEYNQRYPWRDGDPPPPPPEDYLYGEWRPSPAFETHLLMRNYKIVPAVAGLFPVDGFIRFYAQGNDWLVPVGSPQAVMQFDDDILHAPHEPPANLR